MLNELTEIFETQKGSHTSRAQAIKEGMLVDVSGVANKLGFKIPVAITASVWHLCSQGASELAQVTQVLLSLQRAISGKRYRNSAQIHFDLLMVLNEAIKVQLKSILWPDDNGEWVLTIAGQNESVITC